MIFVLTCLLMASERAATYSMHVRCK